MKTIDIYKQHDFLSDRKRALAEELKEAFDTVSPFIEKHTAIVCPDCENVCCIDKHGRYDKNDLMFIEALNTDTTNSLPEREETEPCRFLAESGCTRERWMRPFRCTHFFCDPLLKSLESDNAKLYRTFMYFLQHLMAARNKFLE